MWHLFIKFLLDDILVLRSRLHLAKLYLHCKIQLVAAWCLQLYRCKESKIFFCFKYYCAVFKGGNTPDLSFQQSQKNGLIIISDLIRCCIQFWWAVNVALLTIFCEFSSHEFAKEVTSSLSLVLFCRLKHVNLTLNIYHML